jgi:hypothetical protein
MLGDGLDGSRRIELLTWAASSVQTDPDGSRRIVWMIKQMIKAHPTENRMARQASPRARLMTGDVVGRPQPGTCLPDSGLQRVL